MIKCPYCYEEIQKEDKQCHHCAQFIIDDVIDSDFPSLDKKKCIFCGEKILQESKICKHCHKWLDEVDHMVQDIDPDDLV